MQNGDCVDHRFDPNTKGNADNLPNENGSPSSPAESNVKDNLTVHSNVIHPSELCNPVAVILDLKGNVSKINYTEKDGKAVVVTSKKGCLSRSESSHEQCRVCQQQTEEALLDLGCHCRGELAKAHRTCIDTWFRTKGSNKCEICQQVAVNVASPESQPSANYWVWRVDPAFGRSNIGQGEHRRGCFSPLWIVFSILIGGLLVDVLISLSLGLSALPVNIIIGVLVVLGLGTALRLTLECCHEWSLRRATQRVDIDINHGYQPAV